MRYIEMLYLLALYGLTALLKRIAGAPVSARNAVVTVRVKR